MEFNMSSSDKNGVNIYKFISDNEKTVNDILSGIRSRYYGNHESGVIAQLPIISTGRQSGQTTAIADFVRHNPTLTFGIFPPSSHSFERVFHGLENAHSIDRKIIINNYNRNVKKFDYIILDNLLHYSFYSIGEMIDAMKSNINKYGSARIVGIGC